MNKGYFTMLLLISGLFFSAFKLAAQQNHFIYLQTENKQPFYLKMDRKIISSSASGYLIVPKLQDTNYVFIIGFPKNEWPEQYVSYNVNKQDAGFLFKNFGDKGWGLFNLQTMEVAMAGIKPAEKEVTAAIKKETGLNTVADVVKEAAVPAKAVEEKTVFKEEVKPADTEKIIAPKAAGIVSDTLNAAKEESIFIKEPEKIPVGEVIKKEEPVVITSQIKKIFSITSSEGSDMVYADIANGHTDTIRLFIPVEKTKDIVSVQPEKKLREAIKELPKKEEPPQEVQKKEEPSITETIKQEPKKELPVQKTPKFIDIELPKQKIDTAKEKDPVEEAEKENKVKSAPEEPKATTPARPVIINSDCKNLASDDDFLKLRKKMAAEDKDDDMINLAKKVFKTRCFTTEQVKNLAVLFLKDEGKYKFFDTVYPFVSDSYNFSILQVQLTDEYYISRFKAMIRH